MDEVEFARSIRELALRAHGMITDGESRAELIELRGRFMDVLAAAPDGWLDVRHWIESVVEKLGVREAASRPVKPLKRYWAVGGSRRAKRSQVSRPEA